MPPSGFSKPVVKGALAFIEGCYRELLQEVRDGKHENFEKAIEYELSQIQKALDHIHIDDDGVLVDRHNKGKLMFPDKS